MVSDFGDSNDNKRGNDWWATSTCTWRLDTEVQGTIWPSKSLTTSKVVGYKIQTPALRHSRVVERGSGNHLKVALNSDPDYDYFYPEPTYKVKYALQHHMLAGSKGASRLSNP
ncbi:S2-RNase [Pyrus ussuriensis x Pyrus communis]|uniref:S2-RNase n=1 Tax=Pyrus ussuriensis x Pyrus communis TaxID=2448454 RepID=A0A5N5HUL2_9ROSA|nr:S2-RNase [Pyrus ussuriensis x Pyrus communis]